MASPYSSCFAFLLGLTASLSVHFRAKAVVPVGGEGIECFLSLRLYRMTFPIVLDVSLDVSNQYQ